MPDHALWLYFAEYRVLPQRLERAIDSLVHWSESYLPLTDYT
jgi:hypothetical protein